MASMIDSTYNSRNWRSRMGMQIPTLAIAYVFFTETTNKNNFQRWDTLDVFFALLIFIITLSMLGAIYSTCLFYGSEHVDGVIQMIASDIWNGSIAWFTDTSPYVPDVKRRSLKYKAE